MTEASFSTESTPRLGDIAIVSCLAHSLRRKCEKEKATTEEKSFNHSERYVLKFGNQPPSPLGGIKVAFKFRGGSDLPWRPTDILSSALYGSSGLSSSFFELASYRYGKKVRTPFQAEGQAKESCRYVSLLPLYQLAATLQAIQLGFLLLFTLAQISKLFSYPLVADRASFVYLPQWETPYGTPQAGETIKLKIQALLINGIRTLSLLVRGYAASKLSSLSRQEGHSSVWGCRIFKVGSTACYRGTTDGSEQRISRRAGPFNL
ncbi:hypothetical protein QYF36_003964 [Acer negundo]|nr:hypothetical protein QYF36_003964 [Acer negundo]